MTEFLFSSVLSPTGLYISLGLVIGGLLIWLFLKTSWCKYIFLSFLGIFVILITVFCGYGLNDYYSAKGGVFGFLSSQFKKSDVNVTIQKEKSVYDCSFIVFKQEFSDNQNLYSFSFDDENIIKLDSSKNYQIVFNDSLVPFERLNSNFVGNFKNYFFNSNGDLKFDDTLKIEFNFYSNFTNIKFSTNKGLEAAKYWSNYFAKNGATLIFEEVDCFYDFYYQSDDNFLERNNVYKINFYSEDGETLLFTNFYVLNETFDFSLETNSEYLTYTNFSGWSTKPFSGARKSDLIKEKLYTSLSENLLSFASSDDNIISLYACSDNDIIITPF